MTTPAGPHIDVRLRRRNGPGTENLASDLRRRFGVDVSVSDMLEEEMARHGNDFEGMLADLGHGPVGALSQAPHLRPAAPARGRKKARRPDPALARGLALLTARMQAICARDPAIPGKLGMRSMTRILSTCLDASPAPDGGPGSAAAALNAQIRGASRPLGGRRELEATILSAADELRRNPQAREMAFPALAALIPLAAKLLPSILPALVPLLGNLLGGLIGGKSQSASRRGGKSMMGGIDITQGLGPDGRVTGMGFDAIVTTVMQLLPKLAPILTRMIAGAAPSVINAVMRPPAPPAPMPQMPTPTIALPPGMVMPTAPVAPGQATPARPVSPSPQVDGTPAPAAGPGPGAVPVVAQSLTAAATPGATPAIDPAMIAGLIKQIDPKTITSLIGAVAGNAGGINQLAGGPGHELLKSVVERLPIQKMFDAVALVPEINQDALLATLPLHKLFSLSDAEGVVGQLFVPGRKGIKRDPNIKVALAERTLTPIAGEEAAWIFVTGQSARLQVQVVAGPEALETPFLDVRASCDGSPATGLKRCVFRMAPLAAESMATITVEIDAATLARSVEKGGKLCLSIRAVNKRGSRRNAAFYGAELRLAAHVVRPHCVILDGAAPVRDAPEFADLPGLARPIPASARSGGKRLKWQILVNGPDAAKGLAELAPIRAEPGMDGETLSGGISISPSGFADLSRRLAPVSTTPDMTGHLARAVADDPALRGRLQLEAVERLPADNGPVSFHTVMGAAKATLVCFLDPDANGNPARREVHRIEVPVPLGVALHG